MDEKKGLIKVGAVATQLNISVPHTYHLARTGRIPCVRIGPKAIRFDPDDVERYIQEHRQGKTQPAA